MSSVPTARLPLHSIVCTSDGAASPSPSLTSSSPISQSYIYLHVRYLISPSEHPGSVPDATLEYRGNSNLDARKSHALAPVRHGIVAFSPSFTADAEAKCKRKCTSSLGRVARERQVATALAIAEIDWIRARSSPATTGAGVHHLFDATSAMDLGKSNTLLKMEAGRDPSATYVAPHPR